MERHLAAVNAVASTEVVEALEGLLASARRGEVTGIAFVVLHPGLEYSGDVVGSAIQSPVIARGLVGCLWDRLSVLGCKSK
jgi:hypothetical protein